MSESASFLSDVDESRLLSELEGGIRASSEGDRKKGRAALLQWLRRQVNDPLNELSITELILLAPKSGLTREYCAVLIRCAASDILPEIESNNELSRSLVNICESGLPELYAFLRVDPKAQSYIKYKAVAGAHKVVCDILAPMRGPFSDMAALQANRKQVLGALNHSIVRSYGAAFDIQQIKATAEDIYSKINAVSAAGPTLLTDVAVSEKSIADGKRVLDENGTFLARDFLAPLINYAELALEKFLQDSRGRFTTSIKARAGSDLQKRYPLHEPARELQISIPFTNVGPGLATALKVESSFNSDQVLLSNKTIHLGNIPPGDFSIVLDAFVIEPAEQIKITLLLEWGEIGEAASRSEIYETNVLAQATNVDWKSKEYWHPYSTEPAEGENFIGRAEKVRVLAAKMLRSPMESFYITGQKRVGKTSLALASTELAKTLAQGFEIIDSYHLWGSFAHEDPRASMEDLGQSIEALIKDSVPILRSSAPIDFAGSLAALKRLFDNAFQMAPAKRFVVIIDEFDEIHQELYLHGNLAETFFANLRALSRCKNLCFVLIGGENMPFVMERQGQKLNTFSRVSLSYYDRAKEWSDFRSMIQAPTDGVVSWHDDAVGEVFSIANGNPYFAKMICSAALETAVHERDTDISASEVKLASESSTPFFGANSFVHLWQDGIPKAISEREPEIILRIRALVAIARCYRRGLPPTLSNIFDSRGTTELSEQETAMVLNDFVRREVLFEKDGLFTFLLPIFENWLVDVGASQLAANSLTAELASAAVREEMAAAVRSDEIAKLAQSWTAYRGKHFGSDDIRGWLSQVPSLKDQRLLFEILKRVRIFSDTRVREMLEQSFSFLQPIPEFVIRRRSDRRRNIVVTYVDGEGKSGPHYAAIFAEANMISGECIFPPGDFEKRIQKHLAGGGAVDSIVIVDDLVGTGKSLLGNVQSFLARTTDSIPKATPIRIISLLSTQEGQAVVLNGLQKLTYSDIDFKPCEILSNKDYTFPDDRSGWASQDDFDRARSLCVDIGRKIYKQNPLGYGDKGLLIVFPTNCPNNSLPMLHSPSRGGGVPWSPLFARVTH